MRLNAAHRQKIVMGILSSKSKDKLSKLLEDILTYIQRYFESKLPDEVKRLVGTEFECFLATRSITYRFLSVLDEGYCPPILVDSNNLGVNIFTKEVLIFDGCSRIYSKTRNPSGQLAVNFYLKVVKDLKEELQNPVTKEQTLFANNVQSIKKLVHALSEAERELLKAFSKFTTLEALLNNHPELERFIPSEWNDKRSVARTKTVNDVFNKLDDLSTLV